MLTATILALVGGAMFLFIALLLVGLCRQADAADRATGCK